MVLNIIYNFCSIWKFNMSAMAYYAVWLAEDSNLFYSETTYVMEMSHCWNVPSITLYKVCAWFVDWKTKMATAIGQSFNIRPYWKMNKYFFLETSNLIKIKFYMNNHWMVLCNIFHFFVWIGNPIWTPVQETF